MTMTMAGLMDIESSLKASTFSDQIHDSPALISILKESSILSLLHRIIKDRIVYSIPPATSK